MNNSIQIKRYFSIPYSHLFLFFPGTFFIWIIVKQLLASDRGLDLTDEGLYLLDANPPSNTAAWGFPWGWHTGPFFQIVNYNISSFRTLGGVLLVLLSGYLGLIIINYFCYLYNNYLFCMACIFKFIHANFILFWT
jgi:hypothetical protein